MKYAFLYAFFYAFLRKLNLYSLIQCSLLFYKYFCKINIKYLKFGVFLYHASYTDTLM